MRVLMSEKPDPELPDLPHIVSGMAILPVSSNPGHRALTGRHPGPVLPGVPGGQVKFRLAGGVYGTLQLHTPVTKVTRGSAVTVHTFSTMLPVSVETPVTVCVSRPVRSQPSGCRHRLAALVNELETASPCAVVTFCVTVASKVPVPPAVAPNSSIDPDRATNARGLPAWYSTRTR